MTSVLSFRSERFSALRFLTEGFHQGFRRKFIVFKKKIMRRKLVWCVKESLEISCWTSASWLRQLIFCTYKHAHLSNYFWSMWVLMRDYSVFCCMRQIGHAWRQQRIGKKSSHIKMPELGIKLVTETGTESFCFWGFHKVRGPEAFFFPVYVLKSQHWAIPLWQTCWNITGPLWLTLSVLVSLVLPTRRQAFPQMGKQITKCTRKNTLFSSNVEHVYRPPGRHKQRGTTSNLLSRPLFGCQPVYSLSRLTTPQRWIRLQLCDACGWFLFSSAALQPLKGLADEESVCGHLMLPRMPFKCFSAFNSKTLQARTQTFAQYRSGRNIFQILLLVFWTG